MRESARPQRVSEAPAAATLATRPSRAPAAPHDGRPPSAQRRSYAACYRDHLADARALPPAQVAVFRGDPRVALANVRFGLDNACRDLDAIARDLPTVPLASLLSLADLARALIYADALVPAKAASTGEFFRRVASLKKPRARMLANAEALVDKSLLPARDVAGAQGGKGLPGMIDSALRLHRLYTGHAHAIRGMHPFTVEEVAQLGEDAEWLLEAMKPKTARTRAAPRAAGHTPADDRRRLGTLLTQRHALLRKVGYFLHGDGFGALVPPLLSSTRTPADDEAVDGDPAEPDAEG